MGNYTDNKSNERSEWKVDKDKAIYRVDHGSHHHDLDLSKVPIGDMYERPNSIFGDAHRKSDHIKNKK